MRYIRVVLLTLACGLFCVLPAAAAGDVIILCYHTFLGTHTSSLDFSPAEMAADMNKIAALGYRFVTLEDAIAGKVEGSGNVVITIDDGNHSIYQAYRDVFEPRGIKPELFVYPAIISHRKFAATWEQLKEMEQAGCGIGAHGFYHEYLSPIAFERNEKKCLIEIDRPAAMLEKHLGVRPLLFAYPFGEGSPRAEAALKQAGYTWAFLGDTKVVPVRLDSPTLDRYAVPRTIVYRWSFPDVFRALRKHLEATETLPERTAPPAKKR